MILRFKQWLCNHKWRPMWQTNPFYPDYPGKICQLCMKKVDLTEAELYAEFGISCFLGK